MSNLRNTHVALPTLGVKGHMGAIEVGRRGQGDGTMSPVDYKKFQCRMSLSLIHTHVACQIQVALSHVTIFLEALSLVNKINVALST